MTERQQADEWQRDLNPDPSAGQNRGIHDDLAQKDLRTAYEIKDVHEALGDLTDETLKQIPVLPAGSRLQQGATYLDLRDPARTPFKARGDQSADDYNWYVPKSEVDYQLWNMLTRVSEPARLNQDDQEADAT